MSQVKIAFVGDTHTDILAMYAYLEQYQKDKQIKIDAVVHVGDYGIYENGDFGFLWNGSKTATIPTWVCPGNHESWPMLEKWMRNPDQMVNLRLLPDGEVTSVLGVKIGAIWGNYSPKSYLDPTRIENSRRQKQFSPKKNHIHPRSVEKLGAAGKFDVLVTHDATKNFEPLPGLIKHDPHHDFIRIQLGLEKDDRGGGCPGFLSLYMTGQPRYHFFGHFHKYKVMKLKDPTIVALHCFNYDKEQSVQIVQFEVNEDAGVAASQVA